MKSHKEFYRYTIDNNIYKWNANNGHFIKLTGWVSGEDRRKYPSEIKQECLETLNSDVADLKASTMMTNLVADDFLKEQ